MNADSTARDAVLIGLFFIAYGVLTWATSGAQLPSWRPKVVIDSIDARRLAHVMSRRADLIRQENSDGGD